MLSKRDNDTLTRTGPGAMMGQLMRRYWLPVALAEEVAEPDGAPARIEVLGERFVAFRDTAGKLGLLAEHCPHRGASLALARNEDHGLRCIYHGWKFDVTGQCLDTPTELPEHSLAGRVKARSYPVREVAGVLWAYLGPRDKMPPFPDLQWLQLPPSHSTPFKILEECNYAQALEGGIDFAHAAVLHRNSPWSRTNDDVRERNPRPRVEVQDTAWGFFYTGLWGSDSQTHVRIHPFVFPCWTVVAPNAYGSANGQGDRVVNAWVPRDDGTTWHFQYFYNPTKPVDREWRIRTAGCYVDAAYRKLRNADNRYNQTREAMRTTNLSGIDGVLTQDHAVNESQGPVVDRVQEHLAASDRAVIHVRKVLLEAARDVAEGKDPPGLAPGTTLSHVTSQTADLPEGACWEDVPPASTS
ncbi:MAG TPA: Rieske 2Fe-2S domain-containing protein [Chloroflexota bacterium]|jgi:phenylpropionate dioxygenase-like ring-hydroxylating dioxygenase large terminal subunit